MGFKIRTSGNFDPNELSKQIKNEVLHSPFSTECPNCHREVKVKFGHNVCPHCGASIDVTKGAGWD